MIYTAALHNTTKVHLTTLCGVRLKGVMSAGEVCMSTASVSTAANTGAYCVYCLVQPTTLVSAVYCRLKRASIVFCSGVRLLST